MSIIPNDEYIALPPDCPIEPQGAYLEKESRCYFKLTKKLGEGTFGTVRLGINMQTGEEAAIKILEKIRILQLEDKTRIEREIQLLKCLRHSNIVQLYSVIQTNTTIYLIMEYVPGKELFEYITENKKLTEIESCKFFQQIISGIEYLHKLHIVHRDLKPENLLLNMKTHDLKIVDFGLSNEYGSKKDFLLKSACGSPCYAAPEMLSGKEYKAAPIDIWSSGIILFAMLCGYLPFEDDNLANLYKKIMEGNFEIPDFVSFQAQDLLKKILVVDPNKRYNIKEIKEHPWFNLVNQSMNINEGLLLNHNVIPIDEGVVNDMITILGFNSKEEIRTSVLGNRHNDITTLYYLLMQKRIKKNIESVADLKSNLFLKFIRNNNNLFQKYNYDFNLVIKERKNGYDDTIEKKNLENKEKIVKGRTEKYNRYSKSRLVNSKNSNKTEKYNKYSKISRVDIKKHDNKNSRSTREENKKKIDKVINNKNNGSVSKTDKYNKYKTIYKLDKPERLSSKSKGKDLRNTMTTGTNSSIQSEKISPNVNKLGHKALCSATIPENKLNSLNRKINKFSQPKTKKIYQLGELTYPRPNSSINNNNNACRLIGNISPTHKNNNNNNNKNNNNKPVIKDTNKYSVINGLGNKNNSKNNTYKLIRNINKPGKFISNKLSKSQNENIDYYKLKNNNSNINSNSVSTNFTNTNALKPIDLSNIYYKPKKELIDKITETLRNIKIKYRLTNNRILIENVIDDIFMEIRLENMNNIEGTIIFFRKIRGNESQYNKLSRRVLSKLVN